MTSFPFIVGCGRSGTTLLRAMLDSHPDIAVTPESYFVIPSLRRQTHYGGPDGFRVSALLDDILGAGSFQEWQLNNETVRESILNAAPKSVPDTLQMLYYLYAKFHGKGIPGDKTPYHVLHIASLSRAFPNAQFVHLIRDGRDVAPSIVSAPFGPGSLPRSILFWKSAVEAGRRGGEELGASRYFELHYEDLIASTEESLHRVCDFLHIAYHSTMLKYHERASVVLAGIRQTDHLQGIRREPTAGVRDWRTALSESDLRQFEALAGKTLMTFGYQSSSVSIGQRDEMKATVIRTYDRFLKTTVRTRTRLTHIGPALRPSSPKRPNEH